MRTLISLMLSSVCLVVLVASAQAAKSKAGLAPIQVYAHRGVRAFAPENTMPAYRAGLRIGTDWVDMDIVMTKDGEVLVTHDPILNPDIVRDENGKFLAESQEALRKYPPERIAEYMRKYAVKNLTLSEVKRFDVGRLNPDSAYAKLFPDQLPVDGTGMPTLREVIRYANKTTHNKIGFQIEMKTNPGDPEYSADPEVFARALYAILKSEKIIARAEIQAFDFSCLYALNRLDKEVKTAFLTSRDNEKGGRADFLSDDPKVAGRWTGGKLVRDFGGSIPKMVKAMGGYAWEPEDAALTQESLAEARRLGLKVVVWTWPERLGTAFDPKLTARMIEWGVDGIITDDPGRLNSMLAARNRRVPVRYDAR